jgi:hypothetical protein
MLAGAFMTVKRGEYLAKARQADEKAAKAKDAICGPAGRK